MFCVCFLFLFLMILEGVDGIFSDSVQILLAAPEPSHRNFRGSLRKLCNWTWLRWAHGMNDLYDPVDGSTYKTLIHPCFVKSCHFPPLLLACICLMYWAWLRLIGGWQLFGGSRCGDEPIERKTHHEGKGTCVRHTKNQQHIRKPSS